MKDREELLSDHYNSILSVIDVIGLKTKDINIILEELRYLALKRSGMVENDILNIIEKRNKVIYLKLNMHERIINH